MRNRKRICQIIAIVTVIAMILTGQVYAMPETDNNETVSEDVHVTGGVEQEEVPVQAADIPVGGMGGITPDFHAEASNESNLTGIGGIPYGTIPSSFSLKNEGAESLVKNQGSSGLCWAFTATANMESSMLLKGYATNVDYSELHTGYYTYNNTETDPIGGLAGDTLAANPAITGGRPQDSIKMAACWRGPVNEADLAFSGWPSYKNGAGSPGIAYSKTVAHLQNAYVVDIKANTDSVKQLLMTVGGASLSIDSSDRSGLNWTTGAWYHDDTWFANHNAAGVFPITDHTVSLAGWDDDYPVSNFLESSRPKANGAWLVKNSWGTDVGESGYFWLSYEDTSMSSTVYFYDMEPVDNYDHNYQYDGGLGNGNITIGAGDKYEANIFTAKGNEEISAASFYTNNADVNYEMKVYKNLTTSADPTSGTLVATKTGTEPFTGYHTIQLDQAIPVKEGDTFSIVVKLNKEVILFLYTDESETISSTITSVSTSQPGQSFLSDDGSTWSDLGTSGQSVRVKAFTDDVAFTVTPTETSTPTPTVTPTVTSTPSPTVTVTPTATSTPRPTVTPTATSTPSPTVTVTPTATSTPSPTVTATPTATSTPRPTVTVTPTAVPTVTQRPTVTVTPTAVPTVTQRPTVTVTPTATSTPRPTVTVTPTATSTPSPIVTATPTAVPTVTQRPTVTVTPTTTSTPRPTVTATPTAVPTVTPRPTVTVTPTATSTPRPTVTVTPTTTSTPRPTVTVTPTETSTPRPTVTVTPTETSTPRPTVTEIPTTVPTVTQSPTVTVTPTETSTPRPTVTETPTTVPTVTQRPTVTVTPTTVPTVTQRPTVTVTPTAVPTVTQRPTVTVTPTTTSTPSPTVTVTPTAVPTVTQRPTVIETPRPTTAETPTPSVIPHVTPSTTPQTTPGITQEKAPKYKVLMTLQNSGAVKAGDVVAYSILVENISNQDGSGLTLTDVMTDANGSPLGGSFKEKESDIPQGTTVTYNGNKVKIDKLAGGAKIKLTYSYTIPNDFIGMIQNMALLSDEDGNTMSIGGAENVTIEKAGSGNAGSTGSASSGSGSAGSISTGSGSTGSISTGSGSTGSISTGSSGTRSISSGSGSTQSGSSSYVIVKTVKTDDNTCLYMYLILSLSSLAVGGTVLFNKCRRNKRT